MRGLGDMDKRDTKKLLLEIHSRYKDATEADKKNRQAALEDMKFTHEPGAQWEQQAKTDRGARPCYEFNKVRVTVKRVVNDMRQNRPAGKVHPAEEGDIDTADVLEGLIRNIWNVSDGDTVIDGAAEYQVGGGMGAWRITTKYSSDDSWDQDLTIEAIPNPFALYADPACEDALKRDARYWFLTSRMAGKAFEAKYPKAKKVDFETDDIADLDDKDWNDEETVRICEYWWKEPYSKKLLLLATGETVDAAEVPPEVLPQLQVIRERDVMCHRIMTCIASGDAVLEGPTEWGGREFPFIMVYGESMILDGKKIWFGLPRFAKDAQRAYNFSRTSAIESVAMAPQAKFWATTEQAAGHTDKWAEAHKQNFPFQLYNADPKAPGPPARMGGADIPAALVQEMQIASDDIKAVTGIYDASLGQKSNEQSGRAILARQQQGEIATFNYMDNLAKGIRRTWEILIDLIPKYYDTERSVRILGQDGAAKFAKVNQTLPDGSVLNDLSRGKYDVVVTVGPSWATKRIEASEIYNQLAQANPQLFGVAGDLIMKSMDVPYADEVAERIKAILPPPIQQMLQQDGKASPEVQQAMMQVQQAMQQVQQHGQMVQAAAEEAQQEKALADKAKADVQLAAANLKVQEAQLQAEVAKFQAEVAKAQADLIKRESESEKTTEDAQDVVEREALSVQLQQALAQIQQQAAEFMQASAAVIADIQARTQPIVAMPPKPKITSIKRVGNEYIPQYEAEPTVQ